MRTLLPVRISRGLHLALLLGVSLASDGSMASESSFSISLGDYLAVADARPDIATLEGLDVASDRPFSHGWHASRKTGQGEPARWSESRISVIDVMRSQRRPLKVILDLESLAEHPKLRRQELRVLWNGTPVGKFKLEWGRQTVTVRVPADAQHLGPNRIELVPAYWITPRDLGNSEVNESRGVRLLGARFLDSSAAAVTRESPTRSDAGALGLPPGSAMTYYFVMPEAAQLKGKLSWPSGQRATATISILDEAGSETLLETIELAAREPARSRSVDLDLAGYAGQMVALSFCRSPGSTQAGVYPIEWTDLRLEGLAPKRRVPEKIKQARGRYNVLMVLFDTLRADATEPYGSTTVSTPNLAELAKQGATFLDASSSSSWTRSSVASLFTSADPSAHGILDREDALPVGIPYLPELLQGAGYTTSFMTTNPTTGPDHGFGRGSDHVHKFWRERHDFMRTNPDPTALAEKVWEDFVAPVLPDRNDGKPFFVYLHEPDPHLPYTPPKAFYEPYDFGYRGALSSEMEIIRTIINRQARLEEADVRYLKSLYNAEVTFSDHYLGAILEKLRGSGHDRDTLVVLVADHGEEFLEHGGAGHGVSLYQEQIHVPMIFRLPGVVPAGMQLSAPRALIDVAPTILDLVGVDQPASMSGQSLLADMLDPGQDAPLRPFFAKRKRTWDSVRFGPWKLIREGRNRIGRRFDSYLLFNLAEDPGEILDRWPGELVVGKTLRQILDWHLYRREQEGKGYEPTALPIEELAPDVVEGLKALGYL